MLEELTGLSECSKDSLKTGIRSEGKNGFKRENVTVGDVICFLSL